MPTSYAHYKFGQRVVDLLPPKYQYFAHEYPNYFYAGLHGPDLTFYFVVSPRVADIGSDIHKMSGKQYFSEQGNKILAEMEGSAPQKRIEKMSLSELRGNVLLPALVDLIGLPLRKGVLPQSVILGTRDNELVGEWTTRDVEKKLAYMYGYLCHFALDRTAHKYINEQVEKGVAGHFEIEAEFDRLMMARDGYDPLVHYVTSHIHPDTHIAKRIKQFFPGTTTMDIFTCLFMQKYLLSAMNLPGRLPRILYVSAMNLAGLKKFAELFMPEHPDPRCRETNKVLLDIFEDTIPEAVEMITGLLDVLGGKQEWDEKYLWNFDGEYIGE